MNKTLLFLRQIFWPLPVSDSSRGVSNLEFEPLPPWVDTLARLIGLALTLFGTVEVLGAPLSEWIAALLSGACS